MAQPIIRARGTIAVRRMRYWGSKGRSQCRCTRTHRRKLRHSATVTVSAPATRAPALPVHLRSILPVAPRPGNVPGTIAAPVTRAPTLPVRLCSILPVCIRMPVPPCCPRLPGSATLHRRRNGCWRRSWRGRWRARNVGLCGWVTKLGRFVVHGLASRCIEIERPPSSVADERMPCR